MARIQTGILEYQSTVPFINFAKWINREANLGLIIQNANSTARQVFSPAQSCDGEHRDVVKNLQGSDSSNHEYSRNDSFSNSRLRSSSPIRRTSVIQNSRSAGSESSIFCAWCRENRQPDQHSTKGCEKFHNANVTDQWNVT